uniref:Uncharacterized protein n=1 Tax=Tanacetum cinerariifolium TaxID=118510 RepID=A0A6L2KL45_TANCI|nr:hypothetical protein [Tanacetum cinerariifolium]
MFLNMDQLQKQLDKDKFQDNGSIDKYFAEYTGIEVKQFREILLQHMSSVKKSVDERTRHKRQYDRRVNKRHMQIQKSKVDLGNALDADLVVTESSGTESGKQDTRSRPGNDADANNADIKPVYDKEPMAEPEWQRSQQAPTKNKGKAIVNSPPPTYDQEPTMVDEGDEMSKEKKIDKLMALISLSFKKIYKPTNNNLITSSNTSRANQDNSLRINKGTGEHPEQPESVSDTCLEKEGDTNITIDSLDMSTNRETIDLDDNDLAKERDLLASLIEKLKCEINDSKNRNKFLESSNKNLVNKLKGEIEDFKTKNKILESLNNHFKEANNELSKTNQLMFKDLKKFQAKLDRYLEVNYASNVETDCAKAKGDLMSYKIESQKSLNERSRKINGLNQTILEMKKRSFLHIKKPSP